MPRGDYPQTVPSPDGPRSLRNFLKKVVNTETGEELDGAKLWAMIDDEKLDAFKAHLLVCFITLTMMRLIQRKTKDALPEDGGKGVKWSYGIPGAADADGNPVPTAPAPAP